MTKQVCTGRWLLAVGLLCLAACGSKSPDTEDWQIGPNANGVVVEVPLPDELMDGPLRVPTMGRSLYSIEQQVMFFSFATASRQSVYRYDIAKRRGGWEKRLPQPTAERRPLFYRNELFGSSRLLRQLTPRPVAQPFGSAMLRLAQAEIGYSRTWYNFGFPFGQSGWMTERYGDGALELYLDTATAPAMRLLSQRYRADNYPFMAGWSPDGRFVIIVESLEDAAYYRSLKGLDPMLRFAVFGPFEVEATQSRIIEALTRADTTERQRELDRQLRDGQISPEQRYGVFYEAFAETLRSCSTLLAITGPIKALKLDASQTLKLSDGVGDEDGVYFTFALQTARGTGTLRAAAFYPQTPLPVRRKLVAQIIRYDLEFLGERYALDDCY